eukprot:7909287-Alexandrium_andersonii.AAC.1
MAAQEVVEATRLWEEAEHPERTRLLSAGGPGTGTAWTGVPDGPDAWLTEPQFRIGLQLRLG